MTAPEANEQYLLALCMWREARGETPLGQILVGQVIINRRNDKRKRWPNSIAGVVTQKLQFSAFNRNDPNSTLFPVSSDSVFDFCWHAAGMLLAASKPITPANHYHAGSVSPKWADPAKITNREGNHVFYCL